MSGMTMASVAVKSAVDQIGWLNVGERPRYLVFEVCLGSIDSDAQEVSSSHDKDLSRHTK